MRGSARDGKPRLNARADSLDLLSERAESVRTSEQPDWRASKGLGSSSPDMVGSSKVPTPDAPHRFPNDKPENNLREREREREHERYERDDDNVSASTDASCFTELSFESSRDTGWVWDPTTDGYFKKEDGAQIMAEEGEERWVRSSTGAWEMASAPAPVLESTAWTTMRGQRAHDAGIGDMETQVQREAKEQERRRKKNKNKKKKRKAKRRTQMEQQQMAADAARQMARQARQASKKVLDWARNFPIKIAGWAAKRAARGAAAAAKAEAEYAAAEARRAAEDRDWEQTLTLKIAEVLSTNSDQNQWICPGDPLPIEAKGHLNANIIA